MNILDEIKKKNLESEKVFRYFSEIAAIPHGSGNTKQISDYLAAFAKDHGLEYYQDEAGNVIIIQEATAGYEGASPVILQGHMDMVCEKESGCAIDFKREGPDLYVDGDFLKARGTTLGGDDGIAVAYALAILDSPEIAHPRLEVVLTVDEEIGLLGAECIDLSMLKGKSMLNIDSDVEGHFLTSCAGGATIKSEIPVSYIRQKGLSVSVTVTGLSGGHSGSEIDKEHANANLLMGRFLKYASDRMEIGIAELSGGLKDNAIPRECRAKLVIPAEKEAEFTGYVKEMEQIFQKEYAVADPGVVIVAEAEAEAEHSILSFASMTKVIYYLRSVPDGVLHYSKVIPGLVETSANLGIMLLGEALFTVTSSARSSVSSRKEDVIDRISHLAAFLGGETTVSGDYPAWEYRGESAVRSIVSEVYRELSGEEPVFEAIHAGLECGIFSGKIADLDAVSFGPDNFDIHTPKERLSISSTERVYRFLVELLKRWKK